MRPGARREEDQGFSLTYIEIGNGHPVGGAGVLDGGGCIGAV
jgi:hypothetical protein